MKTLAYFSAVWLAVALVAAVSAGAHVGPLPDRLPVGATGQPDPPRSAASDCPTSADPAGFASAATLLADTGAMADFGRRPTGSPAQRRFIGWLERRFGEVPGVELDAVPYTVERWVGGETALEARPSAGEPAPLAVSGPVPYAAATPADGVEGQVLHMPAGTPLTSPDLRGKVVVRDAVPGSVPNAAFRAVEWFEWDPDGTLLQEIGGTYERDFAGYNQRVTDLEDAAESGAAALIFVHGFPRDQVEGQYAPYEGVRWELPALYVGVDEGERLKQLAREGGSARLRLEAREVPSATRTVIATLPGVSDERVVLESHTDGMNAIWDNGPLAILALARHFAALPKACRPRTLQFVLTTGHLYQRLLGGADRGGGAELEAKELDADYDNGTVALVLALEHLGAREYAARPRAGGPGRVLEPTGRTEPTTIFAGESPALVAATIEQVVRHDLRRTFVLRGADAPGVRIPPHQSFGGEGGAYQQHLIPTIALVTGPWTLYNPSFGIEAVDGELMRRQTLLFADLIHELGSTPRPVLGGGYLVERAARGLICQSAFSTLGLVRCPGDPYG